jgi:NADPH:quinone reductase-like Zn-dependent oxidoreductase
MKALTLVAAGGIQHLRVQELPEPRIQSPDEVLLRVRAFALNRLDLFVAGGLPGVRYAFPLVVGSDGAGTVEAVGTEVTQVRPGDRVMINPALYCNQCDACRSAGDVVCSRLQVVGEHQTGTAAEYIVIPARNLAPVPQSMPWPEAAAFSLAALTAWRMLITRARAEANETVLIWGIGGGVALAALQLARLVKARIIVTSGSDAKLDAARSLGADHTLNHRRDDIAAEVRRLTDGQGADVIVDSVGEQSWQQSLRSLRRAGRYVICGATTGPSVSMDLRRLFWYQWTILGSSLGTAREYEAVVGLAHEGRLWPVIDQVVPLDQALSAYQRLQQGEQFGKLVIEVAQ